MGGLIKWLMTHNGRLAAAFTALLGGAIVMTLYAAVVLRIVRDQPHLAFWLGLAAHAQIAIILTGLLALFVKRKIKAGRDGLEVEDIDDDDGNPQDPV